MIAYTDYRQDNRVRREAETLAALGDYSVVVLCLKESSRPRDYKLEGVRVKELNLSKYQGKKNLNYIKAYLKFLVLAFFSCSKLLLKESVEVVHIHNMPNFIVFSAILPWILGKKIILDIHDTMIETFKAKYGKENNKWILWMLKHEETLAVKLANKVICVNDVQKGVLVQRGISDDKIITLLNVPDPRIFKYEENELKKTNLNGNFNLIYHGTIAKRLGVDFAIHAIAHLKDNIPNIKLHIVGNGEDLEELIKLSRDLNLEEHICFKKAVPIEDILGYLKQMDIGFIPYRKNIATDLSLPVKMLECISVGIPVIVPRLRGIEYYFSDDMVTYFEPGDMNSLTRGMMELYNGSLECVQKVNRAKAFLNEYGWANHKSVLIDLYQSLMGKRS
jgi:glycosyltransferase involved in cell wall biosynthesis